MTVATALELYERASDEYRRATITEHEAKKALELAVLAALGSDQDDPVLPPCEEDDPQRFLCGGRLITLHPGKFRPCLSVEMIEELD